ADSAFVLTAEFQGGLVESRDGRPARRGKADRAPIRNGCGLAVRRLQHKEFRGRLAPDRAVVAEVVQTLVPARRQYLVIKIPRPLKVVRAYRDVCKDRH